MSSNLSSVTCGNTIWGSVLLALLNIWLLSLKKCCITNAVNGTEDAMSWDNSSFDHRGVRSDFKNSVGSRVWDWMPKCRGQWIQTFVSCQFLPLYWFYWYKEVLCLNTEYFNIYIHGIVLPNQGCSVRFMKCWAPWCVDFYPHPSDTSS